MELINIACVVADVMGIGILQYDLAIRKLIIQNKTATGIGNDILLIGECETIHLVWSLTIREVLTDAIGSAGIVISHIRAVCIPLDKHAKIVIKESITYARPEFVIVECSVLGIVVALRKNIKMQICRRFSQLQIHNTANGICIQVGGKRFDDFNPGEHIR